jgi:hypothetical protein
MTEASAVGRVGAPDEVASVVALLMGPDGASISCRDFLMDGGVTAAYWGWSPVLQKKRVQWYVPRLFQSPVPLCFRYAYVISLVLINIALTTPLPFPRARTERTEGGATI